MKDDIMYSWFLPSDGTDLAAQGTNQIVLPVFGDNIPLLAV